MLTLSHTTDTFRGDKYVRERQSHPGLKVVYLAEEGKLVIRQETIGLVHQKVPPNELLEAPVLPLNKPMKESSANDSHKRGEFQELECTYKLVGFP